MAKTARTPHKGFAHTRETLASIVFALILALVFRGFVGQAFVIPTGSMAPTLNGRHIDHICSSCGYRFAVGMDRPPVKVLCPNCGHEDLLTKGQLIADTGDGIFTLSWPFAVGGPLAPQRWDVVVFKAPFRIPSPAFEREGDTNYIKRLIGLPGDIVEIIDGDVYLARCEQVSQAIQDKLVQAPLPLPLTAEETAELDSRLQLAPKTPQAQEALWQIVFDSDYLPAAANGEAAPAWKPADDAKAWTHHGRAFRFDDTAAPASQPASPPDPQFLELTGKDFRDHYGYNADGSSAIVSDLRLSGTINWSGGDGAILLCLSKRDDLYTIELRPQQGVGRALLSSRSAPRQHRELQAWTFPAWKRNHPVRVSFVHVDQQLEAQVDGRVVFRQEFPMTAGEAKRRPRETLPPLARIGGAGLKADVRHLQVYRDVYYQENAPIITVDGNRRLHNELSDKPGWATRGNPMLLRDDEYFVLGDNSPASLDSRRWWQTGAHLANRPEGYRPGTVPADQMIGKAFLVYWPSWYRLGNIPGLRLIPNIGEIRWIH